MSAALVEEVDALVSDVRLVRAAEWLPDSDVEEDWRVSEEDTQVVSLDDTQPFTREELAYAASSGRITIKMAVAPVSERGGTT